MYNRINSAFFCLLAMVVWPFSYLQTLSEATTVVTAKSESIGSCISSAEPMSLVRKSLEVTNNETDDILVAHRRAHYDLSLYDGDAYITKFYREDACKLFPVIAILNVAPKHGPPPPDGSLLPFV